MISEPPQRDTEVRVLPTSDAAKSRHGNGPTLAPWRKLRWGVFLPLAFVANVIVATLAWIIVGLVMM
jgi:hypothetical protein